MMKKLCKKYRGTKSAGFKINGTTDILARFYNLFEYETIKFDLILENSSN